MVILGLILLVLGWVFSIQLLWIIGLVLLIVGLILLAASLAGHGVGGHPWY